MTKAEFPFEKLRIYHEALQYAKKIYLMAAKFPEVERFALANQARRAASSIPLNIAEGRGRSTDKDFIRFLFTARGSLYESITVLQLAYDLEYIKKEDLSLLKTTAFDLSIKIMALIKSLSSRPLDFSTSRPSNI